jgi:hypothetical protein
MYVLHGRRTRAHTRVENLAQVLSLLLQFVQGQGFVLLGEVCQCIHVGMSCYQIGSPLIVTLVKYNLIRFYSID